MMVMVGPSPLETRECAAEMSRPMPKQSDTEQIDLLRGGGIYMHACGASGEFGRLLLSPPF